jgi:hypothetical protein
MNPLLKNLESQLEQLTPTGLSDQGRDRCHAVIDSLVHGDDEERATWSGRSPRMATAAAAALALGLGIGGGWYLGEGNSAGEVARAEADPESASSPVDFDQLDHQAWLVTRDSPDVYVDENGEIREIFREVEVTKEVVKHRESGIVVTVETTDHHLVDSVKSEF